MNRSGNGSSTSPKATSSRPSTVADGALLHQNPVARSVTHAYVGSRRIPSTMAIEELFEGMVDTVGRSAHVETIYGEPVESNGRTVIPAASVSYGFGGGAGGDSPAEGEEDDPGEGAGYGYGYGGGVSAKPVGALEIGEDGTRFVRFDEPAPAGALLAAGVLIGLALARLRR